MSQIKSGYRGVFAGERMYVAQVEAQDRKGWISRQILDDLGEWFGIPEAAESYARRSSELPFWAAFDGGKPVGFVAVLKYFDQAAEIYVMGILKAYHRKGIGRLLVGEVEKWCADQDISYLQVKTLSASHPDTHYEKTRAFYRSVGFVEIEEFPNLWGTANPCLLMIKAIR